MELNYSGVSGADVLIAALSSLPPNQVFLPGSAEYNQACRGKANASMFPSQPLVVVQVASPTDIQTAVRAALQASVAVSVRGGAHSYYGPERFARSGSLVIDTQRLTRVEVLSQDSTSVSVEIEAGVTNAILASAAQQRLPNVIVPCGNCPSVNVTGLYLGGGFSPVAPVTGMTCDRVASVNLVLWDGSLVTATDATHPDLLWALRGGGGGYGVVFSTVLKLDIYAGPCQTITWRTPAAAAPRLLASFHSYFRAPINRKLGGQSLLSAAGATTSLVFLGTAQEALQELRSAGFISPADVFQVVDLGLAQAAAPLDSHATGVVQSVPNFGYSAVLQIAWYVYGSSALQGNLAALAQIAQGLTDPAFNQNIEAIGSQPLSHVQYTGTWITSDFDEKAGETVMSVLAENSAAVVPSEAALVTGIYHFGGGACLDPARMARSAFPWRRACLWSGVWSCPTSTSTLPAVKAANVSAAKSLDRVFRSLPDVQRGQAGAYLNYCGRAYSVAGWQDAIYGSSYAKLQALRQQYDPQEMFQQPLMPELPDKSTRSNPGSKRCPQEESDFRPQSPPFSVLWRALLRLASA